MGTALKDVSPIHNNYLNLPRKGQDIVLELSKTGKISRITRPDPGSNAHTDFEN